MPSTLRPDRSVAVAGWLLCVALLIIAMVIVGGATRLTGSGLSITEWKPISGALPPLGEQDWRLLFAKYQAIPQYRLINSDMTLEAFKSIFWWEWAHRLLGRVFGLVLLLPFALFLWLRQIPNGLLGRCAGLLGLGAMQGLVGWWMVASGLTDRVSVSPERLAVHLGMAFAMLILVSWTALDALMGPQRAATRSPWYRASALLLGGSYLQAMLGALVAGNKAGLVYNDWPMMNDQWLPDHYWGATLWSTLVHSPGAVQLHHRLLAYALWAGAIVAAVLALRTQTAAAPVRNAICTLAMLLTAQAALGIATLMLHVPVWLALMHQLGAAIILLAATGATWTARRY